MTEEKRKFIELLAESGAVLFGDFTAKSGRKTPFTVFRNITAKLETIAPRYKKSGSQMASAYREIKTVR